MAMMRQLRGSQCKSSGKFWAAFFFFFLSSPFPFLIICFSSLPFLFLDTPLDRRKATTLARDTVDAMVRTLDQDPRRMAEWAKRKRAQTKKEKEIDSDSDDDENTFHDTGEKEKERPDGGGGTTPSTSVAAAASAASSGVKKERTAVSASGGGGAAASDGCEVIVISSDSSDDDVMIVEPPQPKSKVRDNGKGKGKGIGKAKVKKAAGKARARAANYDSDEEDESDLDDDADAHLRSISDDEDADDDLQVVGVKGQFALRDFPHTREHCVAKKATFGTEDHCSNCFCMVCDCLVKDCKVWKSHCKATFSDPKWRAARQRAKNAGAASTCGGGAAGSNGDTGGDFDNNSGGSTLYHLGDACNDAFGPTHRKNYNRSHHYDSSHLDDVPFNCSALLKSVQQVYPEEAEKPAGLVVSALRHYQKQSVAFMLANEKAATVVGQAADGRIGTTAERFPKLSYAGDRQEKINTADGNEIRGGWLCDEVGMGKTMCCIATILANPCTDASVKADEVAVKEWLAKERTLAAVANMAFHAYCTALDKMQNFDRTKRQAYSEAELASREARGMWYSKYKNVRDDSKTPAYEALCTAHNQAQTAKGVAEDKYYNELKALGPRPTIKHKATVIVVPPTLLGQWVDEFKKYAPSLKVYSLHGPSGGDSYIKFQSSAKIARDADVLLVSKYLNTTVYVGKDRYFGYGHKIGGDPMAWFHRVIIDEVHIGNIQKWALSSLRWGVTGTPASKSPSDLATVAEWLGQTYEAQHLKSHGRAPNVHKDTMRLHVSKLKMLMIRHTKDMQIGGADALVLPTLQSKAVMLDMSDTERHTYNRCRYLDLDKGQIRSAQWHGGTMMFLGMQLKKTRDAAGGLDADGTKMKALKKALVDLKTTEPHFQVIIFTRKASAHANIVSMAKSLGVATYELNSKTNMAKRHESIREFQTPAKTPRVCIASVNIGSVGVTLTAATRVYLMEPSIDPAAEVQCAGRIHRLGQKKEVLFTRFCFRNTIDEAIVKLHDKFAKNELTIDESRKLSAEGVTLLTSM